MKFLFIHAEKASFSISRMCTLLSVTRAGYYSWRRRPLSQTQENNLQLDKDVHRIFTESRENYGSPRVRQQLKNEGKNVGKPRVEAAMRRLNLVARKRKAFRRTTHSEPSLPVITEVDHPFALKLTTRDYEIEGAERERRGC